VLCFVGGWVEVEIEALKGALREWRLSMREKRSGLALSVVVARLLVDVSLVFVAVHFVELRKLVAYQILSRVGPLLLRPDPKAQLRW